MTAEATTKPSASLEVNEEIHPSASDDNSPAEPQIPRRKSPKMVDMVGLVFMAIATRQLAIVV